MSDFIRREDAIIEMMDNDVDHAQGTDGREVVQILSDIPAADVVPVVHSRWVLGGYDDMYYICKRCGHKQSEYYHKPTANFCPNCGAKMDGEEQNV